MQDILTLLKPRFQSVYNQGRISSGGIGKYKYLFITLLGIIFWGGALYISLRVLRYFSNIEDLGNILAWKLLSMVIITIFSLLIFSSILNSLSKLYLAKDLKLVHAMPVSSYKIFMARWIETTLDSSWMVILYTLPVFVAYGWIHTTGISFYPVMLLSLVLLALAASSIGAIVVMIAVVLVPASRIRTIFVFLGLSLFIMLYIALRILRPERMVDPEVFSVTLFYIKSMSTPSSPFLPSTWCYDALMAAIEGFSGVACFHMLLALSFSVFMGFVLMAVADILYFNGVSRAQTSAARLFSARRLDLPLIKRLSGPVRALVDKEIKTFFRDQTQWSQLFLIAALIGIYIYNFKVLPLDKAPIRTLYLQNMLSFLNMGLAFFVLTAITGRFAFPAVNMEGESIWIIRSGPVSLRSFLWIKYMIYLFPLLIMTLVLIIGTNLLLDVVPFMMALSCINTLLMVPGVVALGIGFGAAFPSFKSENPAQTITSYGGMIFMILSAAFIGAVIVLQAGPVYHILRSQFKSRAYSTFDITWMIFSFGAALVICILVTFLPMRYGEKKLSKSLFES
ncbi:conserved membrane hypothetical protein [Desulfamplus magnetovallimortis]|uniref:ABC-2 type transport system permease protein n=1 Tax=Desulfamplus magnetovallimortis TaxID=1246637 RepID=A0A1W1HA97_9BACT|nr:hypothetical protein [Desulfamplus magnetovallimortis]SLM29424.1 conserved membrane hypothetical protein [Desulfamplus magnetovallimortis]